MNDLSILNAIIRRIVKMRIIIVILAVFLVSCSVKDNAKQKEGLDILGTWELVASQKKQNDVIENDDLSGKRMMKIINESHFAFLNHDIKSDSLKFFVSGGGKYTLKGNQYSEYLEYCNYREWEGEEFEFTLELKGDTLIQRGIEKIEKLGIDREITEKYLKTVN